MIMSKIEILQNNYQPREIAAYIHWVDTQKQIHIYNESFLGLSNVQYTTYDIP